MKYEYTKGENVYEVPYEMAYAIDIYCNDTFLLSLQDHGTWDIVQRLNDKADMLLEHLNRGRL
jgi:hypothetical protein